MSRFSVVKGTNLLSGKSGQRSISSPDGLHCFTNFSLSQRTRIAGPFLSAENAQDLILKIRSRVVPQFSRVKVKMWAAKSLRVSCAVKRPIAAAGGKHITHPAASIVHSDLGVAFSIDSILSPIAFTKGFSEFI